MNRFPNISRRGLVAAAGAFLLNPGGSSAQLNRAKTAEKMLPHPIAEEDRLKIVDARLYPDGTSPAILVELKNLSDDYLITPALMMTLDIAASPEVDSTWAIPWEPVLYPNSSTALLVRLSTAIEDLSLENIHWHLCENLELANPSTIELIDSVKLMNIDSEPWTSGRHYWMDLESNTESVYPVRIPFFLVRDANMRLIGGAIADMVMAVEGQPQTMHVWITEDNQGELSPFTMAPGLLYDMQIEIRFQPIPSPLAPGCPAAMPRIT